VLFLVVLFLIKNKTIFQNSLTSVLGNQTSGLTYDSSTTIGDLVNRDTDGDGIPDWEESLYGLDPTKKETTPGTPDSVALEKLKAQQTAETNGQTSTGTEDTTNLTQTDKFSREFLATVSTLNQNGTLDDATVEKLSSSLAENIKNSAPRKVFLLSDIKINNNATYADMQKYNDALSKILSQKETVPYTATDVLQEFAGDENNVNVAALSKLDPIIQETNKILNEILKISVPQSLATLHLNFLNAIEKLVENLNDIELYDKDPIVAMGAISQYETNSTGLQYAAINLNAAYNKIIQELRPK
jgi:hypothetical protein